MWPNPQENSDLVNSTKNWGLGHIYRRNPKWKASYFVQCKRRCSGVFIITLN